MRHFVIFDIVEQRVKWVGVATDPEMAVKSFTSEIIDALNADKIQTDGEDYTLHIAIKEVSEAEQQEIMDTWDVFQKYDHMVVGHA